jgi:hypothetical protein
MKCGVHYCVVSLLIVFGLYKATIFVYQNPPDVTCASCIYIHFVPIFRSISSSKKDKEKRVLSAQRVLFSINARRRSCDMGRQDHKSLIK